MVITEARSGHFIHDHGFSMAILSWIIMDDFSSYSNHSEDIPIAEPHIMEYYGEYVIWNM